MTIQRTCSECKEAKSLETDFYRVRKGEPKRKTVCKLCERARTLRHYAANKERVIAESRAWNVKNVNKCKGYQKTYREKRKAAELAGLR